MSPEEIRQRAIRRTGRVIQGMNALHDVIAEFPQYLGDELIATIGVTIRGKLASIMDLDGMDLLSTVDLRLPDNMTARDPAKPRLPRAKAPLDLDNYEGGIPIAD